MRLSQGLEADHQPLVINLENPGFFQDLSLLGIRRTDTCRYREALQAENMPESLSFCSPVIAQIAAGKWPTGNLTGHAHTCRNAASGGRHPEEGPGPGRHTGERGLAAGPLLGSASQPALCRLACVPQCAPLLGARGRHHRSTDAAREGGLSHRRANAILDQRLAQFRLQRSCLTRPGSAESAFSVGMAVSQYNVIHPNRLDPTWYKLPNSGGPSWTPY